MLVYEPVANGFLLGCLFELEKIQYNEQIDIFENYVNFVWLKRL